MCVLKLSRFLIVGFKLYCYLLYGYLIDIPPAMVETTIVPIVKYKCGNITDYNNYRCIALARIAFKLFESVLL